MGNTCYMNSIIQALSYTKSLTNLILFNSYLHYINSDNPWGCGSEIVTAYADLIKSLWTGNNRPVSPIDFKRIINSKTDNFTDNQQHDSQEFLQFLLNGLHAELNSFCVDYSVIVKWFQVCLLVAFNGHIIY